MSYGVHHWQHSYSVYQVHNCQVDIETILAGEWKAAIEACEAKQRELYESQYGYDPSMYGSEYNENWRGYPTDPGAYERNLSGDYGGVEWDGIAALSAECEEDKKRLCADVKPGDHRTHKCIFGHKK